MGKYGKIWKNIVNLASCPYADWGWLILNRILHSGEEIWILTSSGKSNVSLSNYTKNTSCFSESFQHFSRALNFQAFVLLSIDTSIHEKKKAETQDKRVATEQERNGVNTFTVCAIAVSVSGLHRAI